MIITRTSIILKIKSFTKKKVKKINLLQKIVLKSSLTTLQYIHVDITEEK